MGEPSDSEHYVLYRVVIHFNDDWDDEAALNRADVVAGDGGFRASWSRFPNVWEALLKQRVPNLEERTLDDVERRMREAFSSDGVVDGFIQRYTFDRVIDLKDQPSIKMSKHGGSRCQGRAKKQI